MIRRSRKTFPGKIFSRALLAVLTVAVAGCSFSGGGYHFAFLRDSMLTLETNHANDPNRP